MHPSPNMLSVFFFSVDETRHLCGTNVWDEIREEIMNE